MGNDFEPYWCRRRSLVDRRAVPLWRADSLVEMPVAWHLDDWPWFEFIPGYAQGLRAPSTVLEIWKGEFEYLYQHLGYG
jgi:hypothetical protein